MKCQILFSGKNNEIVINFSSAELAYYPFDITLKDVFCFAFYFKCKHFVLIDHSLSETICLFCFCVLFSNMYPKN